MWITGLVRKYSDKNYIIHEPWRWTKLFVLVLFALIALRRCSCTHNLLKIYQLRIYKRNGTKFTCRREKTHASTVVYLRNLPFPNCPWRYRVFACNTNLRIRTRLCVSVYSAKTTLVSHHFLNVSFHSFGYWLHETLTSDHYRCHGISILRNVITSFGLLTVYHYVIGRSHGLKHRLQSCPFLKANRRLKIAQSNPIQTSSWQRYGHRNKTGDFHPAFVADSAAEIFARCSSHIFIFSVVYSMDEYLCEKLSRHCGDICRAIGKWIPIKIYIFMNTRLVGRLTVPWATNLFSCLVSKLGFYSQPATWLIQT